MTTGDNRAFFAQHDTEWQGQKVDTERFPSIPDGEYVARVDSVTIATSAKDGTPIIKWRLSIVEGEHKGRILFRSNSTMSQDNRRWLKQDLYRAGLELENMRDIPDRIPALNGRILSVSVKQRADQPKFPNIYLNEWLRDYKDPNPPKTGGESATAPAGSPPPDGAPEGAPEGAPPDDDDGIPF
jgi:hypothetical protein